MSASRMVKREFSKPRGSPSDARIADRRGVAALFSMASVSVPHERHGFSLPCRICTLVWRAREGFLEFLSRSDRKFSGFVLGTQVAHREGGVKLPTNGDGEMTNRAGERKPIPDREPGGGPQPAPSPARPKPTPAPRRYVRGVQLNGLTAGSSTTRVNSAFSQD